ncbi:MAG: hypothetical protein ACI9QD_000951, partial [Thermoproteota archaeon]
PKKPPITKKKVMIKVSLLLSTKKVVSFFTVITPIIC